MRVAGEGDWGVLSGATMALFPTYEQAMAHVHWLLTLGAPAELWSAGGLDKHEKIGPHSGPTGPERNPQP